MTNREEIIALLAQERPPVAIKKIPSQFIAQCHRFMGFTDAEMAKLFDETEGYINAIRVKAEKRYKVNEDSLESLTLDELDEWITNQKKLMLSGQITYNKDKWLMFKEMQNDITKKREAETIEGKDLIVKILSFLKLDFVPAVKELFTRKALVTLKREITAKVFDYLWKSFGKDDSNEELKDDMLNQAIAVVETEITVDSYFDIGDVFVEICMKNHVITDQIDNYLQTEKRPKILGGSTTPDYGGKSKTGGAQFRQKRDKEDKE